MARKGVVISMVDFCVLIRKHNSIQLCKVWEELSSWGIRIAVFILILYVGSVCC